MQVGSGFLGQGAQGALGPAATCYRQGLAASRAAWCGLALARWDASTTPLQVQRGARFAGLCPQRRLVALALAAGGVGLAVG